jgi:hypothetical protein
MKKQIIFLTSMVLMVLSYSVAYSEVIGWVENVRIYPGGSVLKARIDTGAKTSSLDINSIEVSIRNAEDWVHFTVSGLNGEAIHFDKKVHRVVTIKSHLEEDNHGRVVVLMGICLGNAYRETEVNLIDRSGLNYPMLIGRRYLADNNFIVDSALAYSVKPECNEAPIKE